MQGCMQVSPATYCCVGRLQPEGQHALEGLCQGIQSLGSCHVDAGCQCNRVQRLNQFILHPTPHTSVAGKQRQGLMRQGTHSASALVVSYPLPSFPRAQLSLLLLPRPQRKAGCISCITMTMLASACTRWRCAASACIVLSRPPEPPFGVAQAAMHACSSMHALKSPSHLYAYACDACIEQKVDPKGNPTKSAHPARFSPDDKFSRERITLKKRFGILPTQLPAHEM